MYHFGNREELIIEIVRHIEARHDALKPANPEEFTREDFRTWLNVAISETSGRK